MNPDLTLGVAHLSRQGAFRFLGSYRLIRETPDRPSFHVSAGVQGIGVGNPGYAGRFEKNFSLGTATLNLMGGVGFRANEDHAHPIAAGKIELPNHLALGVQWEGHNAHPFATIGFDRYIAGLYLVNGRRLGYMLGARF